MSVTDPNYRTGSITSYHEAMPGVLNIARGVHVRRVQTRNTTILLIRRRSNTSALGGGQSIMEERGGREARISHLSYHRVSRGDDWSTQDPPRRSRASSNVPTLVVLVRASSLSAEALWQHMMSQSEV